jgi:eukaryotic-like serine/threonine-protein kinase
MLWAAVVGKKLWKDMPDAHILRAVINEGAPSPRRENADCDPELERIVMKALASDLEQRYATAVELQEDLERFCETHGFADRPRELGRLVAEHFAETRANDRSRVERELSRVDRVVAIEPPDTGSGSQLASPAVEPQQLTASTRTVSVSTVNALPKAAAPRRRLLWGIPVVLAATGGLYLFGNHEQPEREKAAAEPAVIAAQAARPPASALAESTVRIELRSTPPTAQLFFDDQPLAGNPAVQVMPKDGAPHRARAELPGYRTATADLKASQDDIVSLSLDPLPKPRETTRAKGAPRPPAKSTPKVAGSVTGCAQPFYLDADGIKKIKPQCM